MAYGRLVRIVTGAVVAGLLAATLPAPVSARVVGTEEVLSATPASDRAALEALLARDDVRRQFETFGVDPAQARERVQALDDQQVRDSSRPASISCRPARAWWGSCSRSSSCCW